jgi:beta-lactamase regulating signal transducer with metallopeptidase domain
MNPLNLHFVAQMSVERLGNCLAEGTAIALFAWLLLRLVGRRNSGTRFAVWFCALIAMAAAPLVELSSPATTLHPSAAAVTIPREWSIYLFAAWASIAVIGLARVGYGVWHLRAIRRSCQPILLAECDPKIVRTFEDFGSDRRVELCASEDLRVPTAIGLVKPAVVIPSWALRELSVDELNAVVLHELAHLRRWDDWTNLAQKVLRAVFFFHPAVWWVESRLSLEREMACDDMVLARTENPWAYAECLVSLAEKNFLRRGIALAQAAVGRMRQTSRRVLEILDVRRPKSVSVWKPAPWVVAGFSIVCLASAAHAPRLIAFGDESPAVPGSLHAATVVSAEAPSYVPPVVPAAFIEHQNKGFSPSAKLSPNIPYRPHGVAHRSSAILKVAAPKAYAPPVKIADNTTPSAPEVMKAGTSQQAGSATVVRASAEIDAVAVSQQAVFVVMQDEFGNPVPMMWHVTIWRLTLAPQAPQSHTSTSKSI